MALQKATFDTFVEIPLLFSIQDESLSSFFEANLAAKQALGLTLNQTDPNFIVHLPTLVMLCPEIVLWTEPHTPLL